MKFLKDSKMKGWAVGDTETIFEVPETILFSEEVGATCVVRGIKGIVGVGSSDGLRQIIIKHQGSIRKNCQ